MTQRQLIAKYIDDFGAITPMDAFIDLGITKLSTRIGEMIKDGEQISKTVVKTRNRYGKHIRYMKYSR